MLNKRAITPLIATILLIGFTVVLAAIIITWGSSLTKSILERSESIKEREINCFSDYKINIKKIEVGSNKINLLIQNDGSGNIDKFKVRIYGINGIDNIETSMPLGSYSAEKFEINYNSSKTGSVNEVEVFPFTTQDGEEVICGNIKETKKIGSTTSTIGDGSGGGNGNTGKTIYKRQINIMPSTPLQDFQVKVELRPPGSTSTISAFDYSHSKVENGGDLRFQDQNGNQLSYWIEKWDNTGTSVIWVKIPQTSTDKIFMLYGDSSLISISNVYDVLDFGLRAFYYFDQWFTPSQFREPTCLDKDNVNYNWGTNYVIITQVTGTDSCPNKNAYLSIIWKGWIILDQGPGRYNFFVNVDDYVELWIKNSNLITRSCCGESSNSIDLLPNDQIIAPIQVKYNEVLGNAYLQLTWSPNGQTRTTIPFRNVLSRKIVDPYNEISTDIKEEVVV